jgi:hypothetical protein
LCFEVGTIAPFVLCLLFELLAEYALGLFDAGTTCFSCFLSLGTNATPLGEYNVFSTSIDELNFVELVVTTSEY